MTGMVPVQPKKGYNLRVTGKLLMQKKLSRVTGVVPVHKNEGEYWNSLFILEKIYNSV